MPVTCLAPIPFHPEAWLWNHEKKFRYDLSSLQTFCLRTITIIESSLVIASSYLTSLTDPTACI